MKTFKYWFHVGQGHGQLAGFLKQDFPAGYSGTGRLKLKWSERGIHCCFLL
jgi:hypothetical protein